MISRVINEIIENSINISDFNIEELRGGFAKQVYKITTRADNIKTDNFILYIWRPPFENKLTENQTQGAEYLFPDGFKYFMHNTKLLTGIGIRVPCAIAVGHHDKGDFGRHN